MANFKETSDITLPKIKEPLSKEALHWHQSLEPAKVVKEKGIITHLEQNSFNNDLLVSSRDRISIYNINNMESRRSYQSVSSNKLDIVYWASYRKSDCRLFTSSTEEGKVNIFDTDNSRPIRSLGNNSPHCHVNSVRRSEFVKFNQVVSFSDDKHIKLWDITDGSMVQDIGSDDTTGTTAHQDYVRAGCVVDMGPSLVASGSYDHTVKLWDTREKSMTPVQCFNLANPVEAVISRGTFLIAAAAKSVEVFDMVAGKVMTKLSNIQSKTITCLASYQDYFFTSSLDGNVKIFNTYFSPVTLLSYVPSHLLSICISSKALVVGATDGTVISRRFKSKDTEEKVKEILNAHLVRKQEHQRYFQWRQEEPMDLESLQTMDPDAVIVKEAKRKKLNLAAHDKKLKKFHHSKALDSTLHYHHRKPELVVSMMQELNRRGTLRASLAGRDIQGFTGIMNFLIKNIRDPRFNRVLVDVAIIFCDIYRSCAQESEIQLTLFKKLRDQVEVELKNLNLMMSLSGQIDMLLNNTYSE